MITIIINYLGKGTSLTEAAESVFVSSQQTLNEAKTGEY